VQAAGQAGYLARRTGQEAGYLARRTGQEAEQAGWVGGWNNWTGFRKSKIG